MIRPRVGDFLYSDLEVKVMQADIRNFATIGVTGVVLGALCTDGTVDIKNSRTLASTATELGLKGLYLPHINALLT